MVEFETDYLLADYDVIVAKTGEDASDERLTDALMHDGDWSERGAREVILLARKYGTFILNNALALAAAMDIEDGSCGL